MGYFIDRTGLAVGCVSMLACGGMVAYGTLVNHAIKQTYGLSAAAVFGIVAVLCGWRLFSPDEWFAEKERRNQEWIHRHPVLWRTVIVLWVLLFIWKVARALTGHGWH